jgi:hypothetical protein
MDNGPWTIVNINGPLLIAYCPLSSHGLWSMVYGLKFFSKKFAPFKL